MTSWKYKKVDILPVKAEASYLYETPDGILWCQNNKNGSWEKFWDESEETDEEKTND